MRSKELGGLDPRGFLFSADPTCSKPWRPDHATKRFRKVADSVGVKGELRSFRNFHATELLSDGFDVKTVSGRLTHARTSTTQDRYQARLPATDRLAAEHVANKLRRR
jgi:integrase